VAFVAWFVFSAGGCAAITGLDSISEDPNQCAPNCGKDAQSSGGDVTVDTSSGGNDSTAPETAPGNDTGPADSNNPQDTSTPVEGGANDSAGGDSPSDAIGDVAPDTGSFSDAPFDSGCGDLNTTANCSACGDKCASTSTSVTSASCTGPNNGAGATCSYTCATGYLDCDKDTNPPDLNGCECHSPGAAQSNCGNGQNGPQGCCPVQHSDGLSTNATFYDCNPATSGTTGYTVGLATDACTQFTGNQADCGAGECTNANDAGTGDFVVCGQTSETSECVCWEYMGPNVGKVTTATGSILGQCLCPGSTGTGIQTFNYD
jgi:hypothetical protein